MVSFPAVWRTSAWLWEKLLATEARCLWYSVIIIFLDRMDKVVPSNITPIISKRGGFQTHRNRKFTSGTL